MSETLFEPDNLSATPVITSNRNHYQLLSYLFRYPDNEYIFQIEQCQDFLHSHYPDAGELLLAFTSFVQETPFHALQELYTRAFDVQAICSLDIGYNLFGEDYKRGAFLVQMNKEQNKAQNSCNGELADYLPNVLTLMAKSSDEEFVHDFVEEMLKPALKKMIREFIPANAESKEKMYQEKLKTVIDWPKNSKGIFQRPLQALLHVIEKDFGN